MPPASEVPKAVPHPCRAGGRKLTAAPLGADRVRGEVIGAIPAPQGFDERRIDARGFGIDEDVSHILRPSEIDAVDTADRLVRLLTSSDLFTYRLGTVPRRSEGALILSQENGAAVRVDETANLIVSVPIEKSAGHLGALIEEHVCTALQTGLTVADEILELFDPTHKLTRLVIAAGLESTDYAGWRSLDEHRANPNSMEVPWQREERRPVSLNPPDRTRMALKADRPRIAEDLLTLLRRQYRE